MSLMNNDTLHIATHSNTKASGEAPPKVHGADKDLNPHVKPEHQIKNPTRKKVKDDHPSSPKSPHRQLSSKSPVTSHSLSHQSGRAHQHSKTTPIESKLENPPQPTFYTPQPSCSAPWSIRSYTPIACTIIQSSTPHHKNGDAVDIPYITNTKYTTRRYTLDPKPDPNTDTGDNEEVLDPEIKIPLDTDFMTPHLWKM